MKPNALLQQIVIALALTCLAAANDFIFSQFFTGQLSTKLNLSIIVFCYLGYLNRQSHLPAGRIILLLINISALLICLFTVDRFNTLLLIYLAMIWLNRSLLCYSGVLAVLADLGLCLGSASAVYGVLANGNSVIAALWCFLLLQALHPLIPGKKLPKTTKRTSTSTDTFDQSLQAAENALQAILQKA